MWILLLILTEHFFGLIVKTLKHYENFTISLLFFFQKYPFCGSILEVSLLSIVINVVEIVSMCQIGLRVIFKNYI